MLILDELIRELLSDSLRKKSAYAVDTPPITPSLVFDTEGFGSWLALNRIVNHLAARFFTSPRETFRTMSNGTRFARLLREFERKAVVE